MRIIFKMNLKFYFLLRVMLIYVLKCILSKEIIKYMKSDSRVVDSA